MITFKFLRDTMSLMILSKGFLFLVSHQSLSFENLMYLQKISAFWICDLLVHLLYRVYSGRVCRRGQRMSAFSGLSLNSGVTFSLQMEYMENIYLKIHSSISSPERVRILKCWIMTYGDRQSLWSLVSWSKFLACFLDASKNFMIESMRWFKLSI